MTTIANDSIYTLAADSSVLCPIEIHLGDNGAALAVYDGEPDVAYDSLDALLSAHTIDADDLIALLVSEGDDGGAEAVALHTADECVVEPDHAIEYLALYTGPNGPISSEFVGQDLDDAVEHVAEYSACWYDTAANGLDINPDSDTLDIKLALDAGGWALAKPAANTEEYAIYVRGQ